MKYLKGLGSSNDEDAKQYAKDMSNLIQNIPTTDKGDKALLYQFYDKSEEAGQFRKLLFQSNERLEIITKMEYIVYTELRDFSLDSINRCVGHLMDGMKEVQRKILFVMRSLFKSSNHSKKVLLVAGEVIKKTAYHHTDTSLHDAIINMARRFCGQNQINLMFPDGQFGSRIDKTAASARYVSTRL